MSNLFLGVSYSTTGQIASWITSNSATTTSSVYYSDWSRYYGSQQQLTITEGHAARITLPNNVVVDVAKDGSYTILDNNQVRYKGCRVREFNRFINASDQLEDFIRFMGKRFNVRQSEILNIPIELFINWLIIKACEEDGDDIPSDVKRLEDHTYVKKAKTIPRCKRCGRFISNLFVQKGLVVCSSTCFDKLSMQGA